MNPSRCVGGFTGLRCGLLWLVVALAWTALEAGLLAAEPVVPEELLAGERLPDGYESLHDKLRALHDGRQQFLGALSCAATACHGSQTPHRRFTRAGGNEFVLWSDHDPHAKAAVVLTSPQSQAILRRLGVDATEGGQLSCVGCHRPVNPQPRSPLIEALKGENPALEISSLEGVSCEACHGPAEKWLTTHFRSSGPPPMGRIATDDLLVRARLCADCHVGSAEREVNHDLIAAGHPALRFELASYYQKLPKHWHDQPERAHPQYYERLWAAGQIASAEAALSLLEARAERAKAKDPRSVWPEFAEYACFDCHRPVTVPSGSSVAAKGSPRWNRSHVAGLKYVVAGLGPELSLDLEDALIALDRSMSERLASDAARTIGLANESRRKLNALLSREGHEVALHTAAAAPRNLILSLKKQAASAPFEFDLEEWDSAAQVYAAAAVLEQGHRLRSGASPLEITATATAVLQSRRNLTDWYLLLKSESDQAQVREANERFLAELFRASRQLQQRGDD